MQYPNQAQSTFAISLVRQRGRGKEGDSAHRDPRFYGSDRIHLSVGQIRPRPSADSFRPMLGWRICRSAAATVATLVAAIALFLMLSSALRRFLWKRLNVLPPPSSNGIAEGEKKQRPKRPISTRGRLRLQKVFAARGVGESLVVFHLSLLSKSGLAHFFKSV